ncbi:Clan CA, family C19, ubiquitin hydrolase-like cysteine peptidase [Trichomonas vaginalis G3]|uniref:Ubiquitin carboxyl-terminal hydrolase n=1 Tax=Trichomonas vaginalis (strain ATCC PRA-98 / G3) TaxID=412133 RepID=A2DWH0_TRIV3|nr:ubiquitinyl hydrolase protein [Trichomonas vaginalis G3]EAY15310.1 Clan CA, family C19, ubiquitin hydrolase-like cysteine peptidase [Trichomonas vaginalis G3]KAI5536608.1 ubiquitinyl hydrolase protein [Trichomonas vaginalis G3]|eukprot:XP_001327533.1 Clan CA, family C19, ubiquitin hydrolase-like cysteine peptidase [Trichomonas vaginalis G3]
MKQIKFDWTENKKLINKMIYLGDEPFIFESRVIINKNYFLSIKIHPKENKIQKLKCTIQVFDAEKRLDPENFTIDFTKHLKYPLFFAINPSKFVCMEFSNISIVEKPDLQKIKNSNLNSNYISNNSTSILDMYEYRSNTTYHNNIPQENIPKPIPKEESKVIIKQDPIKENITEKEPKIKEKPEKIISVPKVEKTVAPKKPSFSQPKVGFTYTPQSQIPQEIPKQNYEFHYCGLINQGATCYMNSFLQALYHTPIFRRKFLQMKSEDPVIKSLQNLFQMMNNEKYVSTEDLTTSFGWDSSNVLVQHDVQEFMVILIDYIQEHIKGTPYENLIKSIFGIENETTIIYQNNDTHSLKESQLNISVQLTDSITRGIELLTEPELMGGDDALDHNGVKMSATKILNFRRFPKILMIQLSRFSFDRETFMPIKLMDRCSIVQHIDIGKSYSLYCIVTHLGNSVNLGHYVTYVNSLDDDWYCFNDQCVDILKHSPLNDESITNNAYLLFYYLDECKNEIFHE